MKKRLLCLFLCLVLMLSALLTACSSGDDEDADVDDSNAQTLTMRLISEKEVCNTDKELAAFLADECGGDETDKKYTDMLATKAAYDAVEAEITKITKSKYKINLDLIFYTYDEYFEALEASMDEFAIEQKNAARAERALNKYISDYRAAFPDATFPASRLAIEFYKLYPEFAKYEGSVSFEDEEDEEKNYVEEQYKENELGIKELVYPAAEENQLDIIYVSGLDTYNRYIENEWLASLDQYIGTTGAKLNDYISGALLGGAKVNGSTYAIPNNVQIGEYTYMLIDKELFDGYYHNAANVKSILDIESFLDDIKSSETDVRPLDATFEECIDQFVYYWNIDWEGDDETGYTYSIPSGNEFSVLGALYGEPENAGRGQIKLGFDSLFANSEYREIFLKLKKYEFNGYYAESGDDRPAAVTFTKGDYEIKETIDKAIKENDGEHAAGVYTDKSGKQYYAYVVKYPEVDEKSLYGNMFGVSSNTKNVQGCVQILTLLNTDSTIRNLLQYGIEGVNYNIDEDTKVLERRNESYMMDLEKTGNCFIAYPGEGKSTLISDDNDEDAVDYWAGAKAQNDDALVNPLLGFDFDNELAEYGTRLDNNLWENTKLLSAQTLEKILDCGDYDELYDLLENKTTGFGVTYADNPSMVKEEGKDPITVNLKKLTNPTYDTSSDGSKDADGNPIPDMNGESPYAVYTAWMNTYGYAPK